MNMYYYTAFVLSLVFISPIRSYIYLFLCSIVLVATIDKINKNKLHKVIIYNVILE